MQVRIKLIPIVLRYMEMILMLFRLKIICFTRDVKLPLCVWPLEECVLYICGSLIFLAAFDVNFFKRLDWF